jgi:diguanylate cyclase (GGDEF)-like protein
MRRLSRPTAWKLALLGGFLTQLLLIGFVTAIGQQQLAVATANLKRVVDVDMRKHSLTKSMMLAGRERSMILVLLSRINDPFKRDELFLQFNKQGADFIAARFELLNLPLSERQRNLLELQARQTGIAVPIQSEVIDLVNMDFAEDAAELTLERAIPEQNKVMVYLGQLDEETQRAAMEARLKAEAAHDVARLWMYLLSASALLVGAVVAVIVFRFTSRVSREREQLATHDALTGLTNRRMLMDRLDQSLIRARRHQTMAGILFIDLDRFKRVNDTLGHSSGDQLICAVARRLRETVRAEDTVARLGGDEFVVIINDVTALNSILLVVEKVMAAVSAPYQIAGREFFSSCSIGVSIFPSDGDTAGDLLKHADTAMYHAKHSGRNRFKLYDTAMNAMAEERLQTETDLHYAMQRNEFIFHYQPQLDLETGRIHGVEALIRWQHPQKGLLPPAAFLGMLEETGDIVSVGRALLRDACTQTAQWHRTGFTDLVVAVNLSGMEFWHDTLIDNVRDALDQSGLSPRALQLELTEGIFMENIDAAIDRILALKNLGITVAIDDFGTGYSSLAHLKRFPLDVLKIDRYFVNDINSAPVNETLFSSILALCQGLELGTVAEGIESREQLETLHRLGCRIVQGYYISRPVPAADIDALLSRDWLAAFEMSPDRLKRA